ncbi:hypothetical protein COT52_01755 [candidate division WWE3 bacterium CG08_land_8_20_14_0_20_43_13]|uniref:Polysaccharide chain length determinant N-terminal domain-containing protein n=1 Tax=candidate division WWE3 bacterium CG08_land_8_20_14_0_20_43_13 TaxID=1975087 RepID=A0A2H0X7M0_UNCKA|nr:MAG: hypothetical protein COT52_01755 [candidate division WWE3 bacterium CG08_land_8_20_14_0_20_43_13]
MTIGIFLDKLNRYWKLWLFLAVFGGLLGSLFLFFPPRYRARDLFFVSSPTQALSQDFSYEGYYSYQVSDQFSRTLVGIFEDPLFSRQLVAKYGLPGSYKKVARCILVKPSGPRLVSVTVSSYNREFVTSVKNAVREELSFLTGNLSGETGLELNAAPVWSQASFESVEIPWWLGSLGGLCFGTFLFFLFMLFKSFEFIPPRPSSWEARSNVSI